MSRSTLIALKTLVPKILIWAACLCPFCWLVWGAFTNNLGPNATGAIAYATGRTTLRFFYATVHMLTWVALYNNFDLHSMLADVTRRRYITAGMAAYLSLLPLALTSTAWSIRKLGGKNWNRLHMLIYVAALCGVAHYWWQMKPGVLTPLAMTVVIAALLLARPILAWLQHRGSRATSV